MASGIPNRSAVLRVKAPVAAAAPNAPRNGRRFVPVAPLFRSTDTQWRRPKSSVRCAPSKSAQFLNGHAEGNPGYSQVGLKAAAPALDPTGHSDECRLAWFDQIVPGYWLARHDTTAAIEAAGSICQHLSRRYYKRQCKAVQKVGVEHQAVPFSPIKERDPAEITRQGLEQPSSGPAHRWREGAAGRFCSRWLPHTSTHRP